MANQPEATFVLVDDNDRMAQLRQRRGPNRQNISLVFWTRKLQDATVKTKVNWDRHLRKIKLHQELPYYQFHEVVSLTHFKEDLPNEQYHA